MTTHARTRRNDFLVPALSVVIDAVAIEAAFILAYSLRFNTSFLKFLPLQETIPPLDIYIYSSLVIIPVWLLIFKSAGMYGARRNIAFGDEVITIIQRVTTGMLIVMSAAFFYRAFSYSRVVFVLLWGSSIVWICVGRALVRTIEKSLYRHGRELRNAAIIGNNDLANRIYLALHEHPLLGYRLVGYFADSPCSDAMALMQAEYLGALGEASEQLVRNNVELALLALSESQHPLLFKLMQECEGVNVEFLLAPDTLGLMSGSISVKEIEGIPFIKIKGMPMSSWGRITKRSFDIAVSLFLLALCSPLFVVVAIFIKLDSKGPVLFRQQRVGLDGERFDMLKFRSMLAGAEEETGPVWAADHDSRRTRVGTFLRTTSIDELPQIMNVLSGEMSLVGPRPERPYFVDQFKNHVPKYLDRHRVKTGMTGWAQVNGLRGNTSLEERIRYDIFYVENWSLGFDLKILLRTIRALLGE